MPLDSDERMMLRNFSVSFRYNKYETANPYTDPDVTSNPNLFDFPLPSLYPNPYTNPNPCTTSHPNPDPTCATNIPITNCERLRQHLTISFHKISTDDTYNIMIIIILV